MDDGKNRDWAAEAWAAHERFMELDAEMCMNSWRRQAYEEGFAEGIREGCAKAGLDGESPEVRSLLSLCSWLRSEGRDDEMKAMFGDPALLVKLAEEYKSKCPDGYTG